MPLLPLSLSALLPVASLRLLHHLRRAVGKPVRDDFVLTGTRLCRVALPALAALLSALPAHAAPYEVSDTAGYVTRFPSSPARIVSLLPSLTESVCALGACDRLVGVDKYSNWPDSIQSLPRVGTGLAPNIEAIAALRPDLVLLSDSSHVAERLRALGLKVLAIETRTQADVRCTLGILAAALALAPAEADRVWRHIDAAVQAAAQSLPPRARGLRVFVELSNGPYGAGPASFIGETLTSLGARNVVPSSQGPFPRLSPEFVLRAQPDVLMAISHSQTSITPGDAVPYPGWQNLRALRENRVCRFNSQETDTIVRPGPRMAEGVRTLARCLADKAPK